MEDQQNNQQSFQVVAKFIICFLFKIYRLYSVYYLLPLITPGQRYTSLFQHTHASIECQRYASSFCKIYIMMKHSTLLSMTRCTQCCLN